MNSAIKEKVYDFGADVCGIANIDLFCDAPEGLLNEKYGNLLVLGAVLTNLELPSDPPAESICIKSCRLCLDSCPSQALDGIRANQLNCRTNTYRTNACGYDVVDCNKCRTVCPRKYGKNNK